MITIQKAKPYSRVRRTMYAKHSHIEGKFTDVGKTPFVRRVATIV